MQLLYEWLKLSVRQHPLFTRRQLLKVADGGQPCGPIDVRQAQLGLWPTIGSLGLLCQNFQPAEFIVDEFRAGVAVGFIVLEHQKRDRHQLSGHRRDRHIAMLAFA